MDEDEMEDPIDERYDLEPWERNPQPHLHGLVLCEGECDATNLLED